MNRRRSRTRKAPERIGSIVEHLLADHGYLAICREQDVARKWAELVGERIAEATECTRVERGKVYVHVRSASWRNELVYLKQMLLARLRSECSTISDIIFS
jgi:predicted nucleic acid-binding Zn ribbon protein